MTLTSLLVGMHFRPPAKLILAALPAGTQLDLWREAENPYDPNALAVFVRPSQVPESQYEGLRAEMPGSGFDWDELLLDGRPIQLGYVAASEGKPLRDAGMTVGNVEFLEAMNAPGSDGLGFARLAFGPDGSPRLILVEHPT